MPSYFKLITTLLISDAFFQKFANLIFPRKYKSNECEMNMENMFHIIIFFVT